MSPVVLYCDYDMCCWYYVCSVLLLVVFFFFKRKTAYELRISDWSSDVCSSDLPFARTCEQFAGNGGIHTFPRPEQIDDGKADHHRNAGYDKSIDKRAYSDPPQRTDLPHLGNSDHQCGEQERKHQHEEEPQEYLPYGPGHIADNRLHPGRARCADISDQAKDKDRKSTAKRSTR